MSVIKSKQEESKKIIDSQGMRVLVCAGTGCVACGALDIIEEFKAKGINVSTIQDEKVTVVPTGSVVSIGSLSSKSCKLFDSIIILYL